MADVNVNSITGGGGGGVRLAPDLSFPGSTEAVGVQPYYLVQGIDATAGLTTVLELTGKFTVNLLNLVGLTAENTTVKLTVDSVVVWDNTFVSSTSVYLLGASPVSNDLREAVTCNESFKLEVQVATDTNIGAYYMARPIL